VRRFEELAFLAYNARMKAEPLEVEHLFSDAGGQGVLRFKGPLITQNLPDFQNAIRRENAPTVILDLTDVPYMDSSGLGSLVSAYVSGHKSGRRMALTGLNPRIINLLQITRMEQLFLIFPTLSAALDGLSNPGMA
jgi:anti-sigma B factor antagonist